MSTREELERALEMAERELACANMIDNSARRATQLEYWQRQVNKRRDQLDELGPAASAPIRVADVLEENGR